MRLLVVEDNMRLAEYVSIACRAQGYAVNLVGSLPMRIAQSPARNTMLFSWISAYRTATSRLVAVIRRTGVQTPVLILTARMNVQRLLRD